MHLVGWINPLPLWIVEAIAEGSLTVLQLKGYQVLQGTVTNPQGTTTCFL